MANDRDFLGKGLRFPVSVNLNGGVSSSQLEENVRQSIFIILGTAPGERINRPHFGCQIHDLMFAPNNDHDRGARRGLLRRSDLQVRAAHREGRVHARRRTPTSRTGSTSASST